MGFQRSGFVWGCSEFINFVEFVFGGHKFNLFVFLNTFDMQI